MKFTKKKGYEGTVRKVWNDDKTKCLGVIGTVEDLLAEGFFEECNARKGTWALITLDAKATFAGTREEVVVGLI